MSSMIIDKLILLNKEKIIRCRTQSTSIAVAICNFISKMTQTSLHTDIQNLSRATQRNTEKQWLTQTVTHTNIYRKYQMLLLMPTRVSCTFTTHINSTHTVVYLCSPFSFFFFFLFRFLLLFPNQMFLVHTQWRDEEKKKRLHTKWSQRIKNHIKKIQRNSNHIMNNPSPNKWMKIWMFEKKIRMR